MPSFDQVTQDNVLSALAEYDELGADEFLQRYGFRPARDYVLWHQGRSYDSKAVLGVAHRYATGTPAGSADFSGGKAGAAKVLRALEFEVAVTDDLEAPATGTWQEATDLGRDEARSAWAASAREVLLETAARYHSTVTYKQLAAQVQQRTGIRTPQLMQHWIGDVLARVSSDCADRGEPNLSSLCVNAQGSVGDGYPTGPDESGDLDDLAARDRLACYRLVEASGLPDDGGVAALTAQVYAQRTRTRKAAHAARPVPTCPRCHMALPATGICDECG